MPTKHYFKNIKKNKKENNKRKTQSPSNSRSITEYFKFPFSKINYIKLTKLYGEALKVFVILTFIAAVIVVGLDLQRNLQTKQGIDFQRGVLVKELNFWEDFISKHKDYRDAYFQASILEYKLGDNSKAKMYVEKGLSLDPNSENGKKIEEFLNK